MKQIRRIRRKNINELVQQKKAHMEVCICETSYCIYVRKEAAKHR
jgi:hypothetical protein